MATATGGFLQTLGALGSNNNGKKEGRSVRKYRICVLGPSFVGKT